ncbi:hypothetical protein GCM10012286_63070 [Streptomyces lasiicapitis]|uniref:Uncharacterized protein n=1 Tax=Streptomyces lasiicapitis TaxID=1923961 RepID=A0ABQ2MLP9_9ACTN|nr:hypothetical protein GCM10012286_63070 [Streptomyces lasiicapitis]
MGLGRRPFSTGPEPCGAPIGRGEYDEVSGLHEWYEWPAGTGPRTAQASLTWPQLLDQWPLIEADLHEAYGVDVGHRRLMRARSWRWLRVRVLGLLSADSRLARHLASPDKPSR